MKKHLLTTAACLAALVFSSGAQAGAIPFFQTAYEASAVAITLDGPAGIDLQAGPLGEDVASAAADSIGSTDVATAGAVVGQGLLSASADVSASGLGSAVAVARFVGSFLNAGPVSLGIDFTALDLATGSGSAETTLFVTLVSDGVTLFADFVPTALQGGWAFSYAALPGSLNVLDLLLTSDASVGFLGTEPGNASGFGLVSVSGTVPEPGTWALCLLSLGLVLVLRPRRTAAPVPTAQAA